MHLHPLAGRRACAYALDAIGYVGIAAALVPAGLVLLRVGPPSPGQVVALSAVPPVLAALWAARAESGPTAATWGKRRFGLSVRVRATAAGLGPAEGAAPGFGRALVRNIVKIAVPWQVGHVVAIGAATGGFDRGDALTMTATIIAYPLIAVWVLAVILGSGRGVHDRLASTAVIEAAGKVRSRP
jgi:hypothetical protein